MSVSTDEFAAQHSEQQAIINYSRLALAYLEAGELLSARRHAKSALALDKHASTSLGVMALIAQQEGDVRLANSYFEQALRSAPHDSQVRNNFSVFLFENQRYDEAYEELFQVASDTDYANRARAYENLGMVALRLNRDVDAAKAFERALRLDDSLEFSALELVLLSIERGAWSKAKEYFWHYLNARSLSGTADTMEHSTRALEAGRVLALRSGDERSVRVWQRARDEQAIEEGLIIKP